MASKFGSRRKRGSAKAIGLTALASFALGSAVVGYYYWKNSESNQVLAATSSPISTGSSPAPEASITEPEPPTPSDQATAAAIEETAVAAVEAAEAVERVAVQQGGLDQRLAAAEQRLARLDLQAQAAAGNAARAEGLLIAFATRRAIERGAELGFLADQLRLRFGDNWPNAVRTVIGFSRRPVTLDQLLARLDGLGPELSEGHEMASWSDVRRELGQLFIIRRESTPSPQPERRLERARMFLESGRVDAAIAEIENLPGADRAENWIASAVRYRDAMEALDRLETAAVLEPRQLRDSAGNMVRQPSPVDTDTN